MTPLGRALLLGVIQVVLVSSLAAKLLYERRMEPRAWAKVAPLDPVLPLRGRYLELRLLARLKQRPEDNRVALRVEHGELLAVPDPNRRRPLGNSGVVAWGEAPLTQDLNRRYGHHLEEVQLYPPVLFFISEHAEDPSRLAPGEELWAEVTVPEQGPPRPIRLGVKAGSGPIRELTVRAARR